MILAPGITIGNDVVILKIGNPLTRIALEAIAIKIEIMNPKLAKELWEIAQRDIK
jgi:hypothetical protein